MASGLDNKAAEKAGRPEALGQHARSIGSFLSAVYPTRDMYAGETIDVILSKTLGSDSRVPLLNLATEYAQDQHDTGYSEIFNYSLSWKSPDTPIQPVESPAHVFELLCGNTRASSEGDERARQRRAAGKSVLDSVLESAKTLRPILNPNDKRSLEEYLESVRGIERSIAQNTSADAKACGSNSDLHLEPRSYDDRMKIMLDLLYLALQSGSTQVATLLMGAERSERDFGFLSDSVGFDMSGGHHSTSHHRNKAGNIRKYAQINTYHAGAWRDSCNDSKQHPKEKEISWITRSSSTARPWRMATAMSTTTFRYSLPARVTGWSIRGSRDYTSTMAANRYQTSI